MGGACCVAARDKNIVNGPSSEILHRNTRYSPTWSFRWDNRRRVAGEETSITWFQDANIRNDGTDIKYESAYASEDGSPLDSFRRRAWQKSPTSEAATAHVRTPASDPSILRNISVDTSLEQVKESMEASTVSDPSPTKFSLSLPSTSSITSPISSHINPHTASSTTPSWPDSAHQLMGQGPDAQIPELKSSNSCSAPEERPAIPSWSKKSTRGSHGGSSDGWSMHSFSELLTTSHRGRCSFDDDSLSFRHERTRLNGQISSSPSANLQKCGICSKLLTEKSLWSSQKLVSSNELSVVAVLICGHVHHAECLEIMTPEISKYDPPCPVCTLGEKKTQKLSQKAFKAEMELRAKNKRSRNRVTDSDFDDPIMFDRLKGCGHAGKGPKITTSSSMKGSLAKPFLKRHFSLGSKSSKSLADNHTTKKQGFFWTRSLKV
ncbi:uncharacterized protein LOC110607756 [Manihot esculenta]|uniref:Uncharacterized protein n=1 Tax=Manihot esculenta TaxID=3983 RepID=A0ACB7HUU4_MANES|nr:uncharacterized protein LOC110607756 [Manihot esculenta]XP_021602603.2 uncharacterized protein LOC110607756 [Manihot esculenta]XP_021602604.2 uncharacterized protein LOC110607756 [Manihot esculenta]KAG8655921.1 hypothetical protein MANES_04G087266v8 [Manihot esculenta]